MKPSDFLSSVRLARFDLDGDRRRLERCHSIEDLREAARRYLPRGVFGFVDGGSEDEVAVRRNRSTLDAIRLWPRLRDVSSVDLRTRMLGTDSSLPLALAPTGLTGIVRSRGELDVARAAAAAGIPYTAATMSSVSLEEIASTGPGPRWFQVYRFRDRGLSVEMIHRARAAGYTALVYTVDVPTSGARERDLRNGMTMPPKITGRTLLDGLAHPAWSVQYLRGSALDVPNISQQPGGSSDMVSMSTAAAELDPSVTWDDLGWIVDIWDGPLAVKGILSPHDARRAVEAGVSGIILSNHGGRQLDAAPAPIEVLRDTRDAVGGDVEILLDSGIRRGSDMVRALALGANGCLIGRPYLYGLAVAGQRGVERVIEMMEREVRRTMMFVGASSVAELDGEVVVPGPAASDVIAGT